MEAREFIEKEYMNESKKPKKVVRNDKGEVVPEHCDCGGKVAVFIEGEPIYKCTACGKYYGTMPFPKKSLNKENKIMKKNVVKINETQLRKMVSESVKKVLNEHMSNYGYHDMEDLMHAITSLINPINDIRYFVKDENVQNAIRDFEPHFRVFAQAMRKYCDENGLVMNS